MASLQELLLEEGLELQRRKLPKTRKPVKHRERTQPHESIALPIHICHDRYSFDVSKRKTEKSASKNGSSVFSLRRVRSVSEGSHSESWVPEGSRRHDEPAAPIDEVATRAVISILSGYIGRYVKDVNFRETLREKCKSCLVRKRKEPDNGILVNVELGIEYVEKLVEDEGTIRKELRTRTLRNSIRLLSVVDSLNSKNSKNGSTCGTPNSHIYACAQLYLAIVYKLEKNCRTSARHLLQVFCDSPFLARTHLLPDLWEHFFLPHLLHLKIWYTKELESNLSNLDCAKQEKIMKALGTVYNDQMDKGTTEFALYYKDWLTSGVKAPPIPTVPLPSKPSYRSSRRRSSDSYTSQSTNKNLYQHVFGPTFEQSSINIFDPNGASVDTWDLEEGVKQCSDEDNCRFVNKGDGTDRRSSSQNLKDSRPELFAKTQKPNYSRFFDCRSLPAEWFVDSIYTSRNGSVRKEGSTHSSELSRATFTVCSSDILSECEIAIRIISKAWLDSHGDPSVEAALSEVSVIEGMLEVLFASDDDEILELLISILAEFGGRNKVIRQLILNSDPQLEIFVRLLRSSSLFLKAAVLLYLLKPKAKQMISFEWVPLILRVLEFGDQLQILFTVQCSPQSAAIYLLDQLLTGFDEDRNLENARHVVSLGGVNLLARGIEAGDTHDRSNAALLMTCCIRADGSCRNYIAENLNKASLLELIVLESSKSSYRCAFDLLTELLCLRRRTQMIEFLWGLKEGWSAMPTMNILLAYLQGAPPEEYPLVAAILLQIDLLGDSMKSSVYREEAVDAMIASLDCKICNDEVQERSARALLMLGGRFSCTGEAGAERWLLQQAGFHDSAWDSFSCKEIVIDGFIHSNEEEEATEDWQRKAATVLFKSGNKRLLAALSNSIANGIPSLARASIITVTWMASFLHSIEYEDLHAMACSILMPQLLESLDFDKDPEERVLASYALLNLMKCSESVSMLSTWNNELLDNLQNLSLVTWTASELISIITSSLRHC